MRKCCAFSLGVLLALLTHLSSDRASAACNDDCRVRARFIELDKGTPLRCVRLFNADCFKCVFIGECNPGVPDDAAGPDYPCTIVGKNLSYEFPDPFLCGPICPIPAGRGWREATLEDQFGNGDIDWYLCHKKKN